MSGSRRISKQDGEFYLECKAAFLTMYDDIDDRIESKKTLNTLLQTSGRNPSKAKLDKFWTKDTDELSFTDFVDICKKEPVTSADDLMKAFRKIDLNGDGYISLDELYKIMNSRGENMSRDEVRKIIDEVDDNKDGRLDYNEFTNMVMKTSEESKKFAVKVMERKEKKKRRIEKARSSALAQKELTDDQSGEGKGDYSSQTKSRQLGSSTSLRSCQETVTEDRAKETTEKTKEDDDDNLGAEGQSDNQGSRLSVRSQHDTNLGSKASLKQESEKELSGSKVSLRSQSHDQRKAKDVTGSRASLRSLTKDSSGSKVSLREASKRSSESHDTDVTGSKISLRKGLSDVHGSQVSVKSGLGDVYGSKVSLKSESVHGSRVSLKASAAGVSGSKVSLRSVSREVQGAKVSPRSGSHGLGSKVSSKDVNSDGDSDDTIKDVDNEEDRCKTAEITNTQDGLDPKAKKTETSPSSPKQEESQRTVDLKLKDSTPKLQQKRPSSGRQSSLPPKPEASKARASPRKSGKPVPAAKVLSHKPENNSLKSKPPDNSARTVGEELDYDDDFDIVSTGRPTPRVDLNSSRKDTPKAEVQHTPRTDSKPKAKKDDKGNSHVKSVHSEDRVHAEPVRKATHIGSRSAGTDTHTEDAGKGRKHSTDSTGAKDTGKTQEKKTDDKDVPASNRLMDEIFGSSARVEKHQKNTHAKDDKSAHDKDERHDKSSPAKDEKQEKSSPAKDEKQEKSSPGKDASVAERGQRDTGVSDGAPPKAVPRKDAHQKDEREAKPPSLASRLNDEVEGSRTSLRSGDLGTPVPSPRKSLSSRLSEDDVPRPSPRVTLKKDSKGKSPSVRSMAKLPDARALRDWTKFTSKGCFFYEDDEIVSHVFNLKLRDDSNVFLSAYPINEPEALSLASTEPVDTALYIFDSRGRLVTFTEQRDVTGKYGVKLELTAGEYQVLPYTTGGRFKQRSADQQQHMKEARLVKKDKEDNFVITSAFRRALENIFELCDLDDNGTMSYDEFNWFNVRTSGEELEQAEWGVVEERITLEDGEIPKQGFIELNEMEAEDVKGDTEDLWITLTSMGMNKALIMDEACPFRIDVYVEETGSKKPTFKVTGIESLEKKEFSDEICRHILEKGEPVKVRNMKDLYTCTYRNEHWASIVVDNRSRSTVNLEVDCSKSRNVSSNRDGLDYTFEVDPQTTAIAHHLLPRSELSDWTVNSTETIHK